METQQHHGHKGLFIVVSVLLVIAVAAALYIGFGLGKRSEKATTQSDTAVIDFANTTDTATQDAPTDTPVVTNIRWDFNGSTWQALGTAPACATPLPLTSPVDLSKATAILYPGQTRGDNFKPHGGFLFSGKNEDITVRAPMDGQLTKASRYIEMGEVQYLLFFVNSCGIAYRFDHLLTLSPEMQKIADTLPAAQENNSTTTNISDVVTVKKGDVIATAVGFRNFSNVSVDWGVYDLRSPNAASKDAAFASTYGNFKETTFYGTCWLDLLPADQSKIVKALPAGDQKQGKNSAYCK